VVGLTSGASVPEVLVSGVINALTTHPRGATVDVLDVVQERMHFALPARLRQLPITTPH
jgi:4-hydroxy-3-methylbut-2-enyl diphosphate reductase